MLKRIGYLIFFLLVAGCIEPYEFVVRNSQPSLVVEAYISDKSFTETLSYPSDGRYFTVKLTSTGDVTNVRSAPVKFAQVNLINDKGTSWQYIESDAKSGVYVLMEDDFKAEVGVKYKISIRLQNERIIESDWAALPDIDVDPMGEINFKETEIQKFAMEANERVVVSVKGIWTEVTVPQNRAKAPVFYRWSFVPHWIYKAPLSSVVAAGHKCWVSNSSYIPNYSLQLDRVGDYRKELFFLETKRNERLFEKFSALIIQHTLTEDYFYFWNEMQEQNENGAIINKPPFNLKSNFQALNDDEPAYGYFGVVKEQARRWYFNVKDLSYNVENTLKADCEVDYGGGEIAPECFDCREYSFGQATNIKPSWWVD